MKFVKKFEIQSKNNLTANFYMMKNIKELK